MDAAFDWNHLRTFLAVIDAGSLSAAARRLGLTQPTAGRQIASLEASLGVRLFERAGRSLRATPAAADLALRARDMETAARRVALVASGHSEEVAGIVRLTASELYAAHLLPPLLPVLLDAHPGLRIELVATNDLSDLLRREADIAIRNVRPTDADLVARRLPDDRAAFFATPGFVARHGPFASLANLSGVPFVGFGPSPEFDAQMEKLGITVPEAARRAASRSHVAHWEMARQGLGVGIGPAWLGDGDPALVRAVPSWEPMSFPVWLVARTELRASRRVRIVFDWLAEQLSLRLPGPNPLDASGPGSY